MQAVGDATTSSGRQRGIGSSRSPPVLHEPVRGDPRSRKPRLRVSVSAMPGAGGTKRGEAGSDGGWVSLEDGWRRNGDAQAWGELRTQGSENQFRLFFKYFTNSSECRAGEFSEFLRIFWPAGRISGRRAIGRYAPQCYTFAASVDWA